MSDEIIKEQIDKVLKELDQDINAYYPVAWGVPWEVGVEEKMETIIAFYEKRKQDWVKMLPGISEIGKKTMHAFIRMADLEIEAAESVLFMIKKQGK